MATPQQSELPQQQAAPRVREYRGKPEKQRDPKAINTWQQPTSQRKPNAVQLAPAKLPPPTRRHDTSHVKVSTANPADGAIFGSNLSTRETVGRETFTPGLPALIDISRKTYAELVNDDSSLGKVLLPEYLDYYATAMLWNRIVTLKEKNSQPLTFSERELLMLVQTTPFALPEPLFLAVSSLGNLTTGTKQHLFPEFPSLPEHSFVHTGGYYGPLDHPPPAPDQLQEGAPAAPQPPRHQADPGFDLRHLLYEEIPCLGVTAEAIQHSISNDAPGVYQSRVTHNNQQPSNNLLGFRPLGHRRTEAKNLAIEYGVTEDIFPSYPRHTGYNIELLVALSNILANTKTFKITSVVFSALSEIGAQSQIVIERPLLTEATARQPALRNEIQPFCLVRESESIFGSGVFFCQQLFKENFGDDHSSWSLFPVIPQLWIDNRNDRRTLPIQYLQGVFQTVSQHASTFRMNVIRSIVTTPR